MNTGRDNQVKIEIYRRCAIAREPDRHPGPTAPKRDRIFRGFRIMSSELLNEFIEDARDHLQAAGEHLVVLEKDSGAIEDLNGLLRRLHTIKGNSGFLDLHNIYALLHKAENILQTARETNCSSCPPDLTDCLFSVIDMVDTMLTNLEQKQPDRETGLDGLLVRLDTMESEMTARLEQKTDPIEQPSSRNPQPDGCEPGPPARADSSPQPPYLRLRFNIARLLSDLNDLASEANIPASIPIRETELDTIGRDLAIRGGRKSRLAFELLQSCLAELTANDRPLTGSTVLLIHGLVRNLEAWLDIDICGSPVHIIKLTIEDLEAHGKGTLTEVQRLIEHGINGLVMDLREFSTLDGPKITALKSALKLFPDPDRIGLLLDPTRHHGLMRVFKVMGLDRAFKVFFDETIAESAFSRRRCDHGLIGSRNKPA